MPANMFMRLAFPNVAEYQDKTEAYNTITHAMSDPAIGARGLLQTTHQNPIINQFKMGLLQQQAEQQAAQQRIQQHRDYTNESIGNVLAQQPDLAETRPGLMHLLNMSAQSPEMSKEVMPGLINQFNPFSLGAGTKRFSGLGGEIADNPRVAAPGTVVNVGGGAYKVPAGFMLKDPNNPGAGVVPIPGGPQAIQNRATGEQRKAASFGNRMMRANADILGLEGQGFNPATFSETMQGVTNPTMTENKQFYEAAKADFITAVLRKESGAVISDPEFAREDKKYFPQFGDKPKTIERKRKARETAIKNLVSESAGIYESEYGKPVFDVPPPSGFIIDQ